MRSLFPQLRQYIPWIIIAILAFVVFIPALKGDILTWDDNELITHNYRVHYLSRDTLADMFRVFPRYGKPSFGLYVPLTQVSVAMEYRLVGMSPWLYHLTNILLHVCNSLLVALLVLRIYKNRTIALLTGILFAVHPLHVESVAWVTGRKDVLCLFFYLLAFLTYIKWRTVPRTSTFILFNLLGLAALLAKPLAVSLAPVFLLYDIYTYRRFTWKMLADKVPLSLMAAGSILANLHFQYIYKAFVTEHTQAFYINFLTAAYGVLLYSVKTLLPVRLSPVYPQPQIFILLSVTTFIAVALTAIIIFLACTAWKRWRTLAFLMAFFCITLLPNSQIVPTGLNIYAADRFYYLPGIAFLALVAYVMKRALDQTRIRLVVWPVIVSFVVYLSYTTWSYASVWQTDLSLWTYTQQLLPEYHVVKGNLALAYHNDGQKEHAITLFKELVEERNDPPALANLGLEYYRQGNISSALHYAESAIRTRTNFFQALLVRAAAQAAMNNYDAALADLLHVTSLEPLFPEAHKHKGLIYLQLGYTNNALKTYERYLSLEVQDPEVATHLARLYEHLRNLPRARHWHTHVAQLTDDPHAWYRAGFLSLQLREFATARDAFYHTLQFEPNHAHAWVDLAVAYRELGNNEKALSLSSHASDLTPDSPKVLYDRSCILATSGYTNDALYYLEKALSYAPELRNSAHIDPDFSALRTLPAFQRLVHDEISE